MPSLPTVRVNRKAADRVASGHPWIFASDVIDPGSVGAGDAVRVVDFKGRILGTAHFSSTSQISLRILSKHVECIDERFLLKRIEAAQAFRQRIVSSSDAYRLIHAEGDLLPGLIADRYGDYVVLQLLDQGMDRLAPEIVSVLNALLRPKAIIARNETPSRAKENLPQETAILAGEVPPKIELHMNDRTWQADLLGGQKTGIFLDQRQNYLAVARYAHGRALDCFTGTGGFALHLARACESVEAIDSSAAALGIAKWNAAANGVTNVAFVEANVLEYLPSLVTAHRTFDIVIVDPPAFTKTRSALEKPRGVIRRSICALCDFCNQEEF